MNFIKTTDNELIQGMRAKLYKTITGPIDAMWELLYIASSQNHIIEKEGETIGYCCINEEGALLQIYLEEDYRAIMNEVIKQLITDDLINSASLSSNDSVGFNACLLLSKSHKTNTFCYQHNNNIKESEATFKVELVSANNLSEIKIFLKEQVGMDDTFGYTENLISRKELYMVKKGGTLIATSECRLSDTQPKVADLGIIVNKDYQGKGIATQVLQLQANKVISRGRNPICSTTLDNIGAQKAIKKAGFYCTNIIFDIQL